MFIYGFAKSSQTNISAADERDLADFGALLLALDDDAIETMITTDELKEIEYHDEE